MSYEYKDKCIEIKGPTGNKGPKGDKGDKGNRGDKGIVGDKGEIGNKGPKGDTGEVGDIGPLGNPGPIGLKGPTGEIGPEGLKGDIGDAGEKGDRGDKGDTGLAGPQGAKGEAGDVGEKGDRGPVGVKGNRGNPGPKGVTGPKGDLGPRGDKGPIGDRGEAGFPGLKGDTGPQGNRGPRGDLGPIGDTGILGYKKISPGAIMMRKVLQYIRGQNLECYIDTRFQVPDGTEGLSGIDSKSIIANIIFDYVNFNKVRLVTVPIQHIVSVSLVFPSKQASDNFVNTMENLFNRIKDCTAEKSNVNGINVDAILTANSDLSEAYEFIVQCNCSNDTSPGALTTTNGGAIIGMNPPAVACLCQGKRIRVCDIESDEISIFRKKIEREKDRGATVKRIITQKGEFTDLLDPARPINIGPTCYGAVIFSQDKSLTTLERYVVTLVNLDYICYVEYN